jgi:hypothetical protein
MGVVTTEGVPGRGGMVCAEDDEVRCKVGDAVGRL